jgi:hypothetical protein
MNLENFDKPKIIGSYILDTPQEVIRAVRDVGYVSIEPEDVKNVEGGEAQLSKMLKEVGFEELQPGLYYDPKRIEFKSVNTEKGLDLKYTEDGWEQLDRSVEGRIALLIREIK